MGPQNRRDGKHPDATFQDFRALLHRMQDATHHMAIFSGTRDFIKHKIHNKTYISDEQLHSLELYIYHGVTVQGEGIDGERIFQMCRCTESLSWHAGNRQNDWVWVMQSPGRSYGTLNGRLPWQL